MSTGAAHGGSHARATGAGEPGGRQLEAAVCGRTVSTQPTHEPAVAAVTATNTTQPQPAAAAAPAAEPAQVRSLGRPVSRRPPSSLYTIEARTHTCACARSTRKFGVCLSFKEHFLSPRASVFRPASSIPRPSSWWVSGEGA